MWGNRVSRRHFYYYYYYYFLGQMNNMAHRQSEEIYFPKNPLFVYKFDWFTGTKQFMRPI